MDRRNNLIQQLENFTSRITLDYPMDKVILFGSRATGKTHKFSDVDLLLVSKKFRRVSKLKRSPPLYLKWDLDYPVDFLCYTPEEFESKKKKIGIVRKAVKEGIEIKINKK